MRPQESALWVHWGDHLALIAPGKPTRTEVLWVGLEVGAGRDFLRVNFAGAEKRSKPWPGAR
jgi:hypothetical protein